MNSFDKFPANFYYMRHAQTDAHRNRLICGGEWDLPLNSEGINQAKDSAIRHLAILGHVRSILCSPLTRAKTTAEIFADVLGVPVVAEEGFTEWRLGEWDRRPYDAVPQLFTTEDDPPGGERRIEFQQRVTKSMNALQKIAGPTLIVSHGAVWFTLMKILNLPTRPIDSAVPFRLEKVREQFTIHEI